MANHLYKETGLKKLCVAGGVALNSVANGRILRETPFEDLFIHPAPGDSGGAVGAALYVWHVLLGKPRQFTLEHAYLGQEYNDGEIRAFLDRKGIGYETFDDDEALINRLVIDLMAGKVIGWFQGRFEWGPRALGNRSILADARRADMKDIVNSKIKFREPFRPFALSSWKRGGWLSSSMDCPTPGVNILHATCYSCCPGRAALEKGFRRLITWGQGGCRPYGGSGIHVITVWWRNLGKLPECRCS